MAPTAPEAPAAPEGNAVREATERVGVLLLNLGGPETLDDVQPFLFNLFADPVSVFLFVSTPVNAGPVALQSLERGNAFMKGNSPLLASSPFLGGATSMRHEHVAHVVLQSLPR